MKEKNKTHTGKQWLWRCLLYALGVAVLALGLTLNTKTGLGVSPIISIAFAATKALEVKFSYGVFLLYCLLVLGQFLIRGKDRRWTDLLQLPFSLVFSLLLDVYERWLPLQFDALWQNLLLLLAAVVCTGLGMCLTMNMHLVVNPADGMVQAMGWRLKKEAGLMKNLLDIVCVTMAFILDLCFNSLWTSVGLGTVVAMVLTGRVVSLCNRLFKSPMLRAAGLENEAQ